MMSKHNLFFIAFLSVMGWSCDDEQLPEQKPEVLPPTIALTYPEQGISFDLSTTQNISFTWKNDERISDCVLAFSRTNTMSNPQIIAVTGDQYTLTDSALNELLKTLYLSTYAQATLYWSIVPTTNPGIKVNTPVNKLLRFKRGDWTATSSAINSGFGPLEMFDGAFNTQWCPSGHPAWTIIDMQHEKTVKRLEAHNRMNVKTIECSISVDGQNWMPVGTLNYPTDQNVWKTCTLAQPAAAQYVRLVMEGYSSWAAVSELDVYGFE